MGPMTQVILKYTPELQLEVRSPALWLIYSTDTYVQATAPLSCPQISIYYDDHLDSCYRFFFFEYESYDLSSDFFYGSYTFLQFIMLS